MAASRMRNFCSNRQGAQPQRPSEQTSRNARFVEAGTQHSAHADHMASVAQYSWPGRPASPVACRWWWSGSCPLPSSSAALSGGKCGLGTTLAAPLHQHACGPLCDNGWTASGLENAATGSERYGLLPERAKG
jgi:hypothetical protein